MGSQGPVKYASIQEIGIANDSEDNEVKAQFDALAEAFVDIPSRITKLAGAFKTKFDTMMAKINTAFDQMSTNVTKTVTTIQEDAHEKRDDIRDHVDDTGFKVQKAINALQNKEKDLRETRENDAADRQKELDAAKEDQQKNHKKVLDHLRQHDDQLNEHKGQVGDHKEQLDKHAVKLNRHDHQLGLVKA